MIEAEKRKASFLLHQEGLSPGEIARLMSVSRSTVQAIIKQQGAMPNSVRSDKILIDQVNDSVRTRLGNGQADRTIATTEVKGLLPVFELNMLDQEV